MITSSPISAALAETEVESTNNEVEMSDKGTKDEEEPSAKVESNGAMDAEKEESEGNEGQRDICGSKRMEKRRPDDPDK